MTPLDDPPLSMSESFFFVLIPAYVARNLQNIFVCTCKKSANPILKIGKRMLHRKECIRKSSLIEALFGFNWYHTTVRTYHTIFKREKLMLRLSIEILSYYVLYIEYSQLNYFFCEATVILST